MSRETTEGSWVNGISRGHSWVAMIVGRAENAGESLALPRRLRNREDI